MQQRPGGRPSSQVYAGLAVALLLAACAAAVIYVRYLRYERVAARHVPGDAYLALRVHVEHRVLFEPVRRHLLPLLDTLGSPPEGGRLALWKSAAGVDLPLDLREILLALGPGPRDWVLVLGGKLGRKGVVPALEASLRRDGWTSRGDRVVSPAGLVAGQAPSGCLVLASSSERYDRALLEDSGLRLDVTADVALAALPPAWGGEAAGTLREVRVRGRVGAPVLAVQVDATLAAPVEGSPADLLAEWLGPALPPESGAQQVLGSLVRAPSAGESLSCLGAWPLAEVERALGAAADRVRRVDRNVPPR